MCGVQVTSHRAHRIPGMLIHCSDSVTLVSVLMHLVHTVLDSSCYSAFPQGGVNWSVKLLQYHCNFS